MSRGNSVSQINAAAGPHRVVAPLLEFYFTSGTLRLAVFPWTLIVGANTYTRAPVTLNPTKESAVSSEGFELHLSGFDPAIIELMTAEPYHGKTFRVLKAYIHADNNNVIDTPRGFWLGRMRNMVASESNEKIDVSMFVEHYDIELQRATPLRYADADQQRLFPGDRGCEYTARNTDKTVIWPSKEAQKYGGSLVDHILDAMKRRRG